MYTNPIMLTDSYKLSHFNQYPPEMTGMQSYLEARGGQYKDIVFFGLKYLLEQWLTPIDSHDINRAREIATAHGVPFNERGFRDISDMGYWPVKILAKPEGTLCKTGEPILTIEYTSEKHAWVVNYLETLLMKVWYPCTVASKARFVKQIIKSVYEDIGLEANTSFAYHNFGDRGSTGVEAAELGGAAHLLSFLGTDNFNSLDFINRLYRDSKDNIGFSIPATEHSTVTSWGKDREFKMIENYLESYKGSNIIACVLDSYNIYNAVNFVTTHLKSRIESKEYPTFVIRPDSGNPLEVIPSIFSILEENNCAYTMVTGKERDYKLFNKYRVIWGDGVTPEAILKILELVVSLGFSPANISFGSGGDLMQNVNRDTCKFAMKCCAVKYGTDEWIGIYKEPLHDGFKRSKAGYQTVEGGIEYYNNGLTVPEDTFAMLRERCA